MDQLEDKLGAILGNPDMMQTIMSMARSLGTAAPSPPQEPQPSPDLDPAMLQKIMNFARQTGIDPNQKNLLNALGPYLSRDRVNKLEKAMRAAKLARLATSALGQLQSDR